MNARRAEKESAFRWPDLAGVSVRTLHPLVPFTASPRNPSSRDPYLARPGREVPLIHGSHIAWFLCQSFERDRATACHTMKLSIARCD